MHLLPRMNVMLDFICMRPVDLPEACRMRQSTKWFFFVHSGTRTHNLVICSLIFYRLGYPCFDESCPIQVTFIHTCTSDNNVYIGISSRMMKYIVFCLVHVLHCVTYIYIGLIAKRRTSYLFAFNVQNTTKHFTWSGNVWSCFAYWIQTQDLCVSSLFVIKIYSNV